MTKSKSLLVGMIIIAAAGASLVIEHRAEDNLRENDAALRQQAAQIADLRAEHQRLSNLLVGATAATMEGQAAEVARLRQETAALRKRISELARPALETHGTRPLLAPSIPDPREYYKRLHAMAASKPTDARALATALSFYAHEHQGAFPPSLDQIAPYLQKIRMPLPYTGTNDFELVYQGSLDDLTNLPLRGIAVVRDRQTWPAPSGNLARVYGMADGWWSTVESDDNFQAWEAEHIIPPPPTALK